MKTSRFSILTVAALALAAFAGTAVAAPDILAQAWAVLTDPVAIGSVLAWGPMVRNLQAQHAADAAIAERTHHALAVAHDGERLQTMFVLLHRDLRRPLAQYLDGGGRKPEHWYRSRRMVEVDFSDSPGTFVNLNSPEERATFEAARTVAGAR